MEQNPSGSITKCIYEHRRKDFPGPSLPIRWKEKT